MLAIVALSSIAIAGEMPTSDAIPWDSVLIQDTVVVAIDSDGVRNDTVVTDGHWCFFITRIEYETKLLGMVHPEQVDEVQRDLEVIKAVLKAKHDKPEEP